MIEVAALLREAGFEDRIADKRLAWGAAASSYLPEIRAAIAAGETPILVELAYDLPDDIERSAVIEIDHHGPRAGVGQPSSLRQVFDLLRGRGAPVEWTRRRTLVEANDIGHARGMRSVCASASEIRKIRDDDRAAQGITSDIEAMSRRAIAASRREGGLLVVDTEARTASAIMDFLLPEYGGPDREEADTLVIMPQSVAFFGRGSIIDALKATPGCWYGGALPETGFWGAPRHAIDDVGAFSRRLADMIERTHAGRR
ncbi:hypothetical protein M4J39_04295 [Pleomorphomonas sp. NRKKF1]|nr:hypothetical protein [Pleomorphomonas sp. NRK KF1]